MIRQMKFFAHALYSLFANQSSVNSNPDVKQFTYKNNISVFYKRPGGKKYTVLVIPGFSQSLESWIKIVKMFPKDYSVIVLELPSKGKIKKDTALWSEKDFADFCIEFIHEHIIGEIIFVGHSLGGKIAALISLSLQNRTRLLVLYGVGGVTANFSYKKKIIKILKNFFYNRTSTINFSSIYKKISVPTLLIYGEEDLITPIEVGKKISKIINHAKLKIIPQATHLAHKEHPDIFIKHIKDEL